MIFNKCVTAVLVLACLSCGGDETIAPNDDVTDVYASGETYTPATAEIGVGGTVRFHMTATSEGEGHDADFASIPGAPADIPIVVDTVVSRVFTARGTFEYKCNVHPGMAGDVVVH